MTKPMTKTAPAAATEPILCSTCSSVIATVGSDHRPQQISLRQPYRPQPRLTTSLDC